MQEEGKGAGMPGDAPSLSPLCPRAWDMREGESWIVPSGPSPPSPFHSPQVTVYEKQMFCC